jgi:hypothetical protein
VDTGTLAVEAFEMQGAQAGQRTVQPHGFEIADGWPD